MSNTTSSADKCFSNEDLEYAFLSLSNLKTISEESSIRSTVRNNSGDVDSEYHFDELTQMVESFVMIYNNSHYLNEPLIFETILDYFNKPSFETISDFGQIMNLRLVCKSWKKHIDKVYGRQFILSVFKNRATIHELNHVDIYWFTRLAHIFIITPGQLTFNVSMAALFFANRFIGNEIIENAGIPIALAFVMYLLVYSQPMSIPIRVGGYLIDQVVSLIVNSHSFHQLESQFADLAHGIMNELSFFEKCEIISTVQDTEKYNKYNNHSCYYIIEVTINVDGKTLGYQIKKKYTQFKSLYDSMCNCIKKDVLEVNEEIIEFPVKRWSIFSDSQQVIDERKKVFNRLLELIVSRTDLFHSVDIYSFFHYMDKQHLLLGNTAIESGMQ